MNLDQMQATVARLKRAKMGKDVATLLQLYHPLCEINMPALGLRCKGHAELATGFAQFAAAFGDYDRELAGSALDGDTFISWGPAKVTLRGSFSGYQSSGMRATVMTFVLFRFSAEQIIQEDHYWDMAAICRAAGVPVEAVVESLRSPALHVDAGPVK